VAVGSSNSFELVVIGGGTGGYSAAFRAGQLGIKVALVEEMPRLGGTCLHLGCIPTKAMLESAELYERIRHAADFGVTVKGDVSFDYGAMADRRSQIVERLSKGLDALVKKNKVERIRGRATLRGGKKVHVATLNDEGKADGERVLDANDVILATGSRVKSLPGLEPDGEKIITSDDATTNRSLPKSIIVVGAGAVGVEFASFYHDAGAEVTLLEYLPRIVPLEDLDISKELERSFSRRGINVVTGARFDPAQVKADKSGVRLEVGREGEKPAQVKAEQLLVATGRAPVSDGIGLETTRAKVDKGFVQVNGQMKTAEPHLYAIGDLIGGLLLAHVAAHEGIAAVHAIAGAEPEPVDYLKMPRATYSRPQIASIGRTEEECQRDGLAVRVGKFPFLASGKALIRGEHEGFVKVIADAGTDELLGVHMIGAAVTDLISEASVGMLLESTAWEVGNAVHPHPTLSEALGEAALAVDGKSINF
jgi:dihydrolipoamide dehydrogenase